MVTRTVRAAWCNSSSADVTDRLSWRLLLAAVAGGSLACVGAATARAAPLDQHASNITATDTRSLVAPPLPLPPVAAFQPPDAFLRSARDAVVAGRTGEAQEALERAETRLLDGPATPTLASLPSGSPQVRDIEAALVALAADDRSGAVVAIERALAATATASAVPAHDPPIPVAQPYPPSVPPVVPAVPPALPAFSTFALLPGHWALQGSQYVWVPPETTPRRVRPVVVTTGAYVWEHGAYVWEPARTYPLP